MVDYNFIKNVYNIKFSNKKKSLEQYESLKNISLLNIEKCQSIINTIEFDIQNNYDEKLDIKCFLKYLKEDFNLQKISGKLYFIPNYFNEKFNFKKYNVQRKFFVN